MGSALQLGGLDSLAIPAPSNSRLAGTVMAPIKLAVSRMNDRGGLSSGAFGILDPVHPSTVVNSALIGCISAQGMAMTRAMVVGMRKFDASLARRRYHGTV
jgi:hypothetical protein